MEQPATLSPGGNLQDNRIVDFSVLEAAKENVRPLAGGRRVAALEQVLTTPHKQRDARLQQQRAQHRQAISDALEEDDDPLAAYDEFVKWTLEAYPQGHSAESGLLELLEEVTRVFKDDSNYKGDLRYLKLWVLYATHVDQAAQIYSFLVANEIGTTYAHLYEEYALVLERDGRRKEADEIYQLGINRHARPVNRLKNRHKEFQKRMMSAPALPEPPVSSTNDAATTGPTKKRAVLGSTNSSTMPPAPQIAGRNVAQPNARMQIFVDEEAPARADGNAWPELGTRKGRVKENVREVTKAGETSIKGIRPGAPPTTPKIVPYRDEVLEPTTPSRARVDVMTPKGASTGAEVIRRDPLRNHVAPSASSKAMPPPPPKASSPRPTLNASWEPFAAMVTAAGAAPGRRPEKLAVNMNLLFRPDENNVFGTLGVEYSAQEVRARDLGLFGKRWGPPPPSELATMAKVKFNDEGNESNGKAERRSTSDASDEDRDQTMNTGRMGFTAMLGSVGGGAEPTVTLNTKEALKDVFGMFNSPEKSRRYGKPAGSKHAPIKKLDPTTPGGTRLQPIRTEATPLSNENAIVAQTPKAAFEPFVDENANGPVKKALSVFKPFVDEIPAKTPDAGARRALGTKQGAVAAVKDAKAFNVFTPSTRESTSPSPPPDVFSADPLQPGMEPETVFRLATQQAIPKASFVPFQDEEETPLKVFSRPEGKFAPKSAAFKPFTDSEPQPATSAAPPRKTPLSVVTVPEEREEQSGEGEDHDDGESDFEEQEEQYVDEDMQEHLPEDYDEQDLSYRPPLGRFGDFNVMTPITERTFEFTMTRAIDFPSDAAVEPTSDKVLLQSEAVVVAKKLAAELREVQEPSRSIDEGTSSDVSSGAHERSLLDTISMASHFNPPNPCNPFDPAIMRTVLSLIPQDPMCHDLKAQEAKQLSGLQKFSKKRDRRSGNLSALMTDHDDVFPLHLHRRELRVLTKLGEGGYGAVFKAKDMEGVSVEDDEDEDEDDEENNHLVAVKVVKPRNLWEYHVLRRIHNTLSTRLRASVVQPRELYAFRDESYLLLDLCRQGTLLDLVNQAGPAGVSQQGGSMDELLVMFFTIELLRLVEGLHSAGFIHGDLKIDNCMIRLDDVPGSGLAWDNVFRPSGDDGWAYKGIKMVDFGRTIHMRVFPPNQEFVGDWKATDRDCIEMREGRPWTFQTDYFGLGSIVFCMLFGKYVEASSFNRTADSRAKLAVSLKRYWQVDLWTRLFDLLLNPTLVRDDGSLPITEQLGTVREEMETWLQNNCNRGSNSLKGLLKKVERFTLQD